MEEQKRRPWFFNLNQDGDSAIVRLLHTSVDTIESVNTHRVEVDGKKKRVKCLGEGCPLCERDGNFDKRIFIHLYDYTDDMEKVWDRTDKILPELVKVQESWGPLNTAVVKITRIGNEFPKYEVTTVNPMQYTEVKDLVVDEQLAKFYCLNRNKEAIEQYIATGKFPEKPKFIPKEEYFKMKEQEKESVDIKETTPIVDTDPDNMFSPFISDVTNTPRKV